MKKFYNNFKMHCHCEGFSPWQSNEIASHMFAMTGCGESGRSMVEMLGVLAIIGVLSVAGVGGYTAAMKKYKANELLNEVSKRATIVAMQIASGRAPNISEFGNNTVQGISITADEYTAGAKTFSFSLAGSGLNDICSKLSEAVGDNSFMKVESQCAKITFNADLSKGSSEQSDQVQKPVAGDPCDQDVYGFDNLCFDGQRVNCDMGEWLYWDTSACDLGKICKGNTCVDDTAHEAWHCDNNMVYQKQDGSWTTSYTIWKNFCAYCDGNIPLFAEQYQCFCKNGILYYCDGNSLQTENVGGDYMDCNGKACDGDTLVDI